MAAPAQTLAQNKAKEIEAVEMAEYKSEVYESEIYEIYKAIKETKERIAFLDFVEERFKNRYIELSKEKLKLESEVRLYKEIKEKIEFNEIDEKLENKLRELLLMSDKDVTLRIPGIKESVKSRIEYRISLLQSQINFINTFLREIERSLTITKSQREELERSLSELNSLLNKKLKESSETYFLIESLKILDETIETLEKYHLRVTKDTVEKLKALYNLLIFYNIFIIIQLFTEF
jgi:hypothetical protein